jgi:hypothetical protein
MIKIATHEAGRADLADDLRSALGGKRPRDLA